MSAAELLDGKGELITIEPQTAVTVFTEPGGVKPILEHIAKEVRTFVPDASTTKGRDAIRALAYRITRSKTYLDTAGKQLADEYKEIPKKIDANRKAAREFLEALAEEIRAPLTAWEAEQERIAAEKKAAEEAEKLRIQIEHDYEVAVLMNAEFDRQREEQRRIAEQETVERERRAAEEAARREREMAERRIVEERLRAERAEQARREAEERAERERAEAIARAERAAAEAVEAERRRAEEEAERARQEQAKREADLEHRKARNREALAAVVGLGLTEEQGKSVVKAIIEGRIPHVKIHY